MVIGEALEINLADRDAVKLGIELAERGAKEYTVRGKQGYFPN